MAHPGKDGVVPRFDNRLNGRPESMRLTVVTWNIHKGIGGVDRRYRVERIVDVLAGAGADIAMLQEVAYDMPAAQYHHQAELLGDMLGMRNLAFHPEHAFKNGGYGNLILSRWPLTRVQRVDLKIGWRKQRGILQAKCRVRLGSGSRTVVLHNLHLGLAGSERAQQLERFLSSHPFAGLHHETPVIVGGDFNDLWGSLGPRFLQPAGFRRVGPLVNTFPAWLPIRPLDALFIRGDLRERELECPRTQLARTASDHRPLVARLELPRRQKTNGDSRPG